MTDQELKDLVASLAIESKKTDEQLRKSEEEFNKRIAKSEEDFNKRIAKSEEDFNKRMARLDARLEKVGMMLGGIGNSQGEVAEEYFINSLSKKPKILNITFDKVLSNLEGRVGKLKDEYDIILLNGESAAIIEVKYKVHPRDVEKLDKKVETFKKLFPEYKHLKLYTGIAGFKVVKDAFEKAYEKGYFILQRNGNVIDTFADELKAA
jgi:hypothetical protein